MKTLIASLIAAAATVTTLQAHCGSCSTDEMHGAHGDSHAACYSSTLEGYFAIQEALAGDDLAAANAAASDLADGLAQAECSLEGKDCCVEAKAASQTIAGADTIAAARKAFLGFSQVMIAQVESHGSDTAAYQMHCPMAFNNQGGAWLQQDDQLRNPYYGASMLTCGMQKAAYGEDAKQGSHH